MIPNDFREEKLMATKKSKIDTMEDSEMPISQKVRCFLFLYIGKLPIPHLFRAIISIPKYFLWVENLFCNGDTL